MIDLELIKSLIAPLGALLFWVRLRTLSSTRPPQPQEESGPENHPILDHLSIIIPARNEGHNLPQLLFSLKNIVSPATQVIVVDDDSTDQTAQIARAAGVDLIQLTAGERPMAWRGKPFACAKGAAQARGEYLLFLDADVTLFRESIRNAANFMHENNLGLISALPYHLNPAFWEQLLGAFQLLLIAALRPTRKAERDKPFFAIGQFLLFRRSAYEQIGGHAAVKHLICEDIGLAKAALDQNIGYGVYTGERPLFGVRMYEKPLELIHGWRRNIRAGTGFFHLVPVVEVTLYIVGGISILVEPTLVANILSYLIILLTVLFYQRRIGHFSRWGAVLSPLSIFLFVLISALSLYDTVCKKEFRWKGRQYKS